MFFDIMVFLRTSFLIMNFSLYLSFKNDFLELLGVKVKLSLAFHPQMDGQIEQINQVLE